MGEPRGGWREAWPPDEPVYAHTPGHNGTWHDFAAHSLSTAQLAAEFALAFGGERVAYLAGLLHDAGKLSADVQNALRRRAVDGGPRLGVPHKREGVGLAARYLQENVVARVVVEQVIWGHHHALSRYGAEVLDAADAAIAFPTGLEPVASRTACELADCLTSAISGVAVPAFLTRDHSVDTRRDIELFVRMVHSALVDADFLDTAAHFASLSTPRVSSPRGMTCLRDHFMAWHADRYASAPASALNELRTGVFARCVAAATQAMDAKVFRLPAPTGSGKTMAAAAFALNHAAVLGQDRVIVAVPFTSITTQNAAEYRRAFEHLDVQVVLEHHSNVVDPEIAEDRWRRLSSENWDAEFIVTTTVQLFESIFSGTPASARKLHRIANSVIVFDEIQALPYEFLPTILQVLRQLTENFGVTVLLASATQPAFWKLPVWQDVPHLDILPVDSVAAVSQRAAYDVRPDPCTWESIAEEVSSLRQALVIVNSTGDAQLLHRLVAEGRHAHVLHLSTRMCGQHRTDVLARVRSLLAAGEPVILVSTQLIEAGVDIDFPVVFRAMAPAESLVQSAGRCNREGSLGVCGGRVVVFDPADGQIPGGIYQRATTITRDLFARRGRSLADPRALTEYYIQFYSGVAAGSERSRLVDEARPAWDFPTVRENFQMIDDKSISVVVTDYGPVGDREAVAALLNRLRTQPATVLWAAERQLLQRYSAAVSRFRADERPEIESLAGVTVWGGDYHPDRGLVLDSVGTIW
ncbi:MAG: CRISPR-associated helicase Cas3' [Propionicimonas sp.]|uniref:CRISPR-associated helicase Cas3' n=1 Tax=Propionicimonas sp. TaxID=1955623 RepID=UPI003D100B71